MFAPHIWISSSDDRGSALSLKSRSDRQARFGRAKPCGTFSTSQATSELRFDWVICGADAEPEEMMIGFDVLDAEGQVIGEENIAFQLVDNGFYFPPDGP